MFRNLMNFRKTPAMSKKVLIIAIAMLAVIAVTGCGKKNDTEDQKPKKQVQIQTISKQNEVVNKLTVSGAVVPKQYSIIRSLSPGTVEYLAPVGSEVSQGQSLFRIRDANIENAFFNAQRNLDQTLVISDQRVVQSELNTNSAEASLELAQSDLEIAERQASLNTTTALNSALVNYSSAYNVITQALVSLSKGNLDKFEYSFNTIPTSETQLRSDVSTQLNIASGAFLSLPDEPSADAIDTQLDQLHNVLTEVKRALDMTALLFQSAITGPDVQQSTLDSNISINTTFQSQTNLYVNSTISSVNALTNANIANDLSVKKAQNAVDIAQVQFDNSNIALESARESATLERSISQGGFDAAAYHYSNLTLPSPFSGKILSHAVTSGQQVSVGQELLEVGNLAIVEIDLEIDSSLASGLAIGDAVVIEGGIDGFISEIEPIGDLQSGKIGIAVQADNVETQLVAGSIADVQFTLVFTTDEAIIIPIRSATIQESGTTLLVIENGFAAERTVTLGQLYGDKVSVLDGLNEGDHVILPNGIFISAGEEVEPLE